MSNARRLTGVNGRPIAAPEPAEPERERVCPDGGKCHGSTIAAGSTPCAAVDPPVCFRVVHAGPFSNVFPGDQWPVPIRDDPAPMVNIDGILVPPAFGDHNRLEWKDATIDGAVGPIRTTAKTGRGWYRCGCGWGSGPLDPNDLTRRAPIPQGDAWEEWADHLPDGFLAFREALVLWRDDHVGLTIPPIGWDGVDRYAWRTWGKPIIDDAGKIVVPRKPSCRAGHATRREWCGECDLMPDDPPVAADG